ncbi:hypothetical protein ACMWP8_28500, partial [Escherichia coli]
DTIRVVATFFDRDVTQGIAKSRELLYGSARARSYRVMRELLLGLYADMLITHGEYDEALAVLSNAVTHPGHAICFPMQRASALL